MRVLVVGGGSGGHITPAIAVVREILAMKPRARVEFWTDWKYYKNVVKLTTLGRAGGDLPMRVKRVMSGKFRRYAGWSLVDYFKNWQITLVDLIWKNFWGFWGFIAGLVQSFVRLVPKDKRPDVIFLKGGFVGLPVGLVARMLKIPYVIHESDAAAGLANRVLMRKAARVAMGMPFEASEMRKNWEWVGIPIGEKFRKTSDLKRRSLKKTLGFVESKPLVIITGGSQGAEHLNKTTVKILDDLLKEASVGLVAGRKHYEDMTDIKKKYEIWEEAKLMTNFRMWEFNSNMDELFGAADVVVSRAGATTIAELAAVARAAVLVPFERLPGAYQVKNAERLVEKGAAEMILDGEMEKHPKKLLEKIMELIRHAKKREELALKLHEEAKYDSAKRLAEIIIEVGDGRNR